MCSTRACKRTVLISAFINKNTLRTAGKITEKLTCSTEIPTVLALGEHIEVSVIGFLRIETDLIYDRFDIYVLCMMTLEN